MRSQVNWQITRTPLVDKQINFFSDEKNGGGIRELEYGKTEKKLFGH